MQNIDEGGGTLLDNCMILYTSYMADSGHGIQDYPTLLVGKSAGQIQDGTASGLSCRHACGQSVRRNAQRHGR